MTSHETELAAPAMPPRMHCNLQAEHVEQIESLVRRTSFFSCSEVAIAVELVTERLEKGFASGYEFVLAQDQDSQLLGYTCYGEIPCTVGSYDVYWIVVDPRHQRQKIGQSLMQETERQILQLGGRLMYIDTSGRPQYSPTRRFYERCGFAPVAELPDFYGVDDAKVIYAKRLKLEPIG